MVRLVAAASRTPRSPNPTSKILPSVFIRPTLATAIASWGQASANRQTAVTRARAPRFYQETHG